MPSQSLKSLQRRGARRRRSGPTSITASSRDGLSSSWQDRLRGRRRLLSPCRLKLPKQLARIKAHRFGKLEKLDHIDPTLSILDVRNERLMASEPFGDLGLLETAFLAISDEKLHEATMARRTQGAGHAGPDGREPAG